MRKQIIKLGIEKETSIPLANRRGIDEKTEGDQVASLSGGLDRTHAGSAKSKTENQRSGHTSVWKGVTNSLWLNGGTQKVAGNIQKSKTNISKFGRDKMKKLNIGRTQRSFSLGGKPRTGRPSGGVLCRTTTKGGRNEERPKSSKGGSSTPKRGAYKIKRRAKCQT